MKKSSSRSLIPAASAESSPRRAQSGGYRRRL
jgi:hypothetical protein